MSAKLIHFPDAEDDDLLAWTAALRRRSMARAMDRDRQRAAAIRRARHQAAEEEHTGRAARLRRWESRIAA